MALEPGDTSTCSPAYGDGGETICIEGYLEVVLYVEASGQDETGGERKFVEVSRVTLCPREGKYGVQIPLGVWHSVDVKEPTPSLRLKMVRMWHNKNRRPYSKRKYCDLLK